MDNMLFHGHCIDILGSMVILRGWGGGATIYYRKIKTKNLNCTNAKKNSRKGIESSPSCSLKSTMNQQKRKLKGRG